MVKPSITLAVDGSVILALWSAGSLFSIFDVTGIVTPFRLKKGFSLALSEKTKSDKSSKSFIKRTPCIDFEYSIISEFVKLILLRPPE